MPDVDLYYLILEGSNARVLWKDREPLQVEEAHVEFWLAYYRRIMRDKPGELVAMRVTEWWRRFSKSAWTARLEADPRGLNNSGEGAR